MEIENIFAYWKPNTGLSEGDLHKNLSSLPYELSSDYVQFMHKYDGGEGWIAITTS